MRPSRRRLAAVLVACAVCATLWMHMPVMPRPDPAAPLPRGVVKPLPDEPAPIKVVPADAAATTHAAAPDTVAPWRRPHDAAEARRANAEQRIFNADKFPWDAAHAEASVIVVMVHDRPPYLHALLATLAEARSIAHALVVFSMDVVSPDIEAELDAIDFCAYMRLYLPHAVAFHPTSFPGNDPNDCPRDATRAAAEAMGCNNAKHPDKYGHYRESKFCAIKHHWWWKLVFTFEEVRAVEAYAGMVLLLEEDYAVTPDALPVMRLAAAVAAEQCPACVFLTLGQYTPGADAGLVRIGPWQSVKHNMGMALNRSC